MAGAAPKWSAPLHVRSFIHSFILVSRKTVIQAEGTALQRGGLMNVRVSIWFARCGKGLAQFLAQKGFVEWMNGNEKQERQLASPLGQSRLGPSPSEMHSRVLVGLSEPTLTPGWSLPPGGRVIAEG